VRSLSKGDEHSPSPTAMKGEDPAEQAKARMTLEQYLMKQQEQAKR